MSVDRERNMAASVRARLLAKAKTENLAFNQVLQRYAMERVLYRLSVSDYAASFYLKGALLFLVWDLPERRSTMDIDLLGFMENSMEQVESAFRAICSQNVPDDGLVIELDTLRAQRIKQDADYEGVRLTFRARLDTAVISIQVDVGFGDQIGSRSTQLDFPVLLDMPIPRLWCYSAETVIAEKFEAMVKLELLNSRMKDFYDIWLLSRQNSFEMDALQRACKATFERRQTECTVDNPLFGAEMRDSPAKQQQWMAFRKKSKLSACPESFGLLLDELFVFLLPIGRNLESEAVSSETWEPGGPWKFGDDGREF